MTPENNMTIELIVSPVTRFTVGLYVPAEDCSPETGPRGARFIGEFASPEQAREVAAAIARICTGVVVDETQPSPAEGV